ncbi:MAG: hypothetical protein JWO31_432 [Phycisphaerales bacterium]|nr:hypothetical protein [Phycisphaerales bacterium]
MRPTRTRAARTPLALLAPALLSAAMCCTFPGCSDGGRDDGVTAGGVGSGGTTANPANTAGFRTKINQLRPGASKAVVLRELGNPDERRLGVAGAQPTGPQPPVTIAAGSRYEQWVYRRGDSEYHVFMGPSADRTGQWEVHAVSANPARAGTLER